MNKHVVYRGLFHIRVHVLFCSSKSPSVGRSAGISHVCLLCGFVCCLLRAYVQDGHLLPATDLCFSLVLPARTIDLAASTPGQLRDWLAVLRPLIAQPALVESPPLVLVPGDRQLHRQLPSFAHCEPSTTTMTTTTTTNIARSISHGARETKAAVGASAAAAVAAAAGQLPGSPGVYPHPIHADVQQRPQEGDESSTVRSRPRINTVEQVLFWRSTVFNHARHNRCV